MKLLEKVNKDKQQINSKLNGGIESVFKFCFSMCLVGSSRGGKTTALKNILFDNRYKILDRLSDQDIFIISPTVFMDDNMNDIVNGLKKRYKLFDSDEQLYSDVDRGVKKI